MEATEKHIKFTGAHIEVNQDYDINARVIFQGEGEVTKQEMRSVGKDGEFTRVTHVMPLVVTFQQSDGVYKEPETGLSIKKSLSKQLYDLLWVDWKKNFAHKIPDFEVYRHSYMNRRMDEIRARLD